MNCYKRVFLIVLDSVGIGELPDAELYGDKGANTLRHIDETMESGLKLPHMQKLGLANIKPLATITPVKQPLAYYTQMSEASVGKDTMTGHWELMGLRITEPFLVFPDGFAPELIAELEKRTGRKVIGNKPASGTEIMEELGEQHMQTGALIVYTSADSVLQIAAHEEIIPLTELYQICKIARTLTLDPRYKVGRVIARPFIGKPGKFQRTANRHDYALKPFGRTTLNELKDSGYEVNAIGKIYDIYDGEGITKYVTTKSNMDGVDKFITALKSDFAGLCFLNLVDFDAVYGHRRDPLGYGKALEEFDGRLPEIMAQLTSTDLLIITADHGNDPTMPGTDHTREYVPLLLYSPGHISEGSLPVRETFADIAATIADNFQITMPEYGSSFLSLLK